MRKFYIYIIIKKSYLYIILIEIFLVLTLLVFNQQRKVFSTDLQVEYYNIIMKQDLLTLMMAYPKYITDIQNNNGNVKIILKSGQKILYDDKNKKTENQKLNSPDLQDMLEQIYPLNDIKTIMPKGNDPGRIRIYPLLKEVYGTSKNTIRPNITTIRSQYKNYIFNKNNNASAALKNVIQEIDTLIKSNPKLWSFMFPTSGTFNYRYIAGTGRLSPHSFGIAIDLASDKKDYWKWATKRQGQERLDIYPREIVKIFEKNNFIWGGKWTHFDILHFEYRPEIIIKAKYFSNIPNPSKPWYQNVDTSDPNIKKYIALINEKIK